MGAFALVALIAVVAALAAFAAVATVPSPVEPLEFMAELVTTPLSLAPSPASAPLDVVSPPPVGSVRETTSVIS
jgi:hypothetical protein